MGFVAWISAIGVDGIIAKWDEDGKERCFRVGLQDSAGYWDAEALVQHSHDKDFYSYAFDETFDIDKDQSFINKEGALCLKFKLDDESGDDKKLEITATGVDNAITQNSPDAEGRFDYDDF